MKLVTQPYESNEYEDDEVVWNIRRKSLLKNQRFLFLRNVEDLEPDAKQLPDNLRKIFKDLVDASMMKEALRSIYYIASNAAEAEATFKNWCSIARQTQIKGLIDMAKTIENNLDGIIAGLQTPSQMPACRALTIKSKVSQVGLLVQE